MLPLLSSVLLSVFLLLPTLVLLLRGLGADFLETLLGEVARDALWVSLWTTALTVLLSVTLGTPIALLLARRNFPGKTLLDTLLDLPIVLPPLVAGVALLLTFELAGISIAFSPAAVVLAQLFTSAPLYLRTAKAGFLSVALEVEDAARVDGAGEFGVFWRVTWPLAFPFLLEGMVLTWARALGEFGATLLFAGSLQGQTRTLTLAIYGALESDLKPALVLSAVLVVVAFGVLFLVRFLAAGREGSRV